MTIVEVLQLVGAQIITPFEARQILKIDQLLEEKK